MSQGRKNERRSFQFVGAGPCPVSAGNGTTELPEVASSSFLPLPLQRPGTLPAPLGPTRGLQGCRSLATRSDHPDPQVEEALRRSASSLPAPEASVRTQAGCSQTLGLGKGWSPATGQEDHSLTAEAMGASPITNGPLPKSTWASRSGSKALHARVRAMWT